MSGPDRIEGTSDPERAPRDAVWDRVLPPEEFARREQLAVRGLAGPEGDEMRAFCRWFRRRYPTPLARLRYARRQTAAIAATQAKIALAR